MIIPHESTFTACPTKIVLKGGHSVTGFKLMILVDYKFDQVIQRSIKLTLKLVGMGGIHPLVRRLPAISHRIILWSQRFLILSINIPSTRQLSHFFTILTGFPKNSAKTKPRLSFSGIEITKLIFFFNFFITKSPNFII